MGDKKYCCYFCGLTTGTLLIASFQLCVTIFMILFAFAYDHIIFFFVLIALLFLYDIIFVYHKVVPGEDRVQWRMALFLLLTYITLAWVFYGILFIYRVYNDVPKELCEVSKNGNDGWIIDEHNCAALTTGVRGNLILFIWVAWYLYMAYVHLMYYYEGLNAMSMWDTATLSF